jgi:hypothetical protein
MALRCIGQGQRDRRGCSDRQLDFIGSVNPAVKALQFEMSGAVLEANSLVTKKGKCTKAENLM